MDGPARGPSSPPSISVSPTGGSPRSNTERDLGDAGGRSVDGTGSDRPGRPLEVPDTAPPGTADVRTGDETATGADREPDEAALEGDAIRYRSPIGVVSSTAQPFAIVSVVVILMVVLLIGARPVPGEQRRTTSPAGSAESDESPEEL